MKKQKMPPMSITNGLQLSETDKEIKEQNLQLTELKGALIAKNIIFQKIYQLPKSGWTALKDRVMNFPIEENSFMNTLDRVPRTPEAAGLIVVAMKKKTEDKNSHKHQLIDLHKLFRMLDKLKTYKIHITNSMMTTATTRTVARKQIQLDMMEFSLMTYKKM